MRLRAMIAAALIGAVSQITLAQAQAVPEVNFGTGTLQSWFDQSEISGTVRAYDFDRLYGASGVRNQSAFGLGGILNLKSASFLGGFSIGGSLFEATSLGLNNTNDAPGFPHLDVTMLGAHNDITALGQAYVQYQNPLVLVRFGNQEISTPWLGMSDSRLLPATYQAALIDITPIKPLDLIGFRQTAWKSRTSTTYYQDNLYYPSTFNGDSIYGGSASLNANAPKSRGTLAFGATYAANAIKANVWYYDFYNFTNLVYGDSSYTLDTGTAIDPFIGGQYLHEWDADSDLNADRFGAAINGVKGNGVNATAFGLQFGINYKLDAPGFGAGILALSYNNLPVHRGSIGDGGIVSPYTVGYATEPLYTTALIRGLVELGPGDAKRVALTQHFWNNQILATIAFSRFDTKLNGGSNDTYADLTYSFGGHLKGLSLRDRMEVSNAAFAFNNGMKGNNGHSFIYNRVQLQYNF